MHKFIIQDVPKTDPENPVLYKVQFGNMYYLHKGKLLFDSIEKFLDDVFRGMRGKKCSESYSKVVEHCRKYPALHKVSIEIVLNGEPEKILKKEAQLYKTMAKDKLSLNRTDIEPYKPEWMIKSSLQKRCGDCIQSGIIDDKKMLFKFCPVCGRLIRK
jgi:hypothetical protein